MRVRSLTVLSVAAVALLALAGCSSSSSSSSASASASASVDLCDAVVSSGTASDAVTVTGDVGSTPTVSFTSPLDAGDDQQSTVVTVGTGDVIADGDYITYGYSAYDASTGEVVSDYEVSSTPAPVAAETILGDAFGCAAVGTRVVTTVPATSTDSDATVYVIDLLSAVAADSWCQPSAPTDGEAFPTVTFDDDGTPTVTVPSSEAAPTEVTEQVLVQGSGDTVASGDTVTVDYQGVLWSDGSIFDTSFGTGDPLSIATTSVVAGFGNALVGQQVGSSVVVVIPAECGYGTDTTNDTTGLAGQTLIFVITIEATTAS
ncbi:MAG: FKBP-type peptidyl-prolyl cis-trans isomerase [Microbacterium sp.]|uniref:FKBP-type peptidyl-prolyl cis-trans isomerase n=1 Tax=Microbacterium sp. TaxID=51671 RepID=UPI0039E6BE65